MNQKTVLVIDDDPAMLDAYRVIFELAGYHITALASPESVLDGSAVIPDAYILDKQLSGVDGLDICRFLKANPATQQLPVIIASASPHSAHLALLAKADDFIEKPFRRKQLLDIVEKHLQA